MALILINMRLCQVTFVIESLHLPDSYKLQIFCNKISFLQPVCVPLQLSQPEGAKVVKYFSFILSAAARKPSRGHPYQIPHACHHQASHQALHSSLPPFLVPHDSILFAWWERQRGTYWKEGRDASPGEYFDRGDNSHSSVYWYWQIDFSHWRRGIIVRLL